MVLLNLIYLSILLFLNILVLLQKMLSNFKNKFNFMQQKYRTVLLKDILKIKICYLAFMYLLFLHLYINLLRLSDDKLC